MRYSLSLLFAPLLALALAGCDTAAMDDSADAPLALAQTASTTEAETASATLSDISGPTARGIQCEGTYSIPYGTSGSFTIESGSATILSQSAPSTVPHTAQIRSNANSGGSFVIGFRQSGTNALLETLTVSQPSGYTCIQGPTTLGALCQGTYTNGYSPPHSYAILSGSATIVSQTPPTTVPHVATIVNAGGTFVIGLYKGASLMERLTVSNGPADCG